MVVPPHDRVIGGYFTGFLARRNYPQPTGTRPAAGIKASPNIGTTNGGQAQKYNCSTRMISTSYCLRGLSTAHAEPQRWHTTFAETAVIGGARDGGRAPPGDRTLAVGHRDAGTLSRFSATRNTMWGMPERRPDLMDAHIQTAETIRQACVA